MTGGAVGKYEGRVVCLVLVCYAERAVLCLGVDHDGGNSDALQLSVTDGLTD